MLECCEGIRAVASGCSTFEDAADEIAKYLYTGFTDKDTGDPAFALARFYKTVRFDKLETELQAYVSDVSGTAVAADTNCLTLLGTAGDLGEWSDRRQSRSHRAIPLPDVDALGALPMVAQLMRQLGISPKNVVKPDPKLFRKLDESSYNVFYVPTALASPHVPAQDDFVIPHSIASVLGFGGVLPDGHVFATVMFSKKPIPEAIADSFSTVAVGTKLAVVHLTTGPTFRSNAHLHVEDTSAEHELFRLRAELAAMNQYLQVRQRSVVDQSLALELALQESEERHRALLESQIALQRSEARKSAVVDVALDCIVSMDAEGRVIEFNPAAETTFGWSRSEAVGQQLSELIIPERFRDQHRQGLATYLSTGVGRILNQRMEVTALRLDGTEFLAELTITPVPEPDAPIFTGYLRDISGRRAAEMDVLDSRARFAHIARTLQQSLLPPALPNIPGLDLGSVYCASGTDNDVGGDFYDVFEIRDSDWVLTLGDVCGKGAAAAAVTSLVRHTIRAVAVRQPNPRNVLEIVNEAVNRDHPERFCTLAYARLRSSEGGRFSMTLASGGHPAPLIISPTGAIRPVAAHGMLLGPFETWTGNDQTVDLDPGDVVVLFSDGITEAGQGDDRFGDARLRQVVKNHLSESAQAIADALADEAGDFAETFSDDVTILVAKVSPQ